MELYLEAIPVSKLISDTLTIVKPLVAKKRKRPKLCG